MESKTLIFQDSELKAALKQRGENVSMVGLRDLKRYYALLNHHLLELSLTVGEANFICETLKDYQFEDDPKQSRTLWRRVNDAVQQNCLDQKWQINDKAFIRKLQGLTNLQAVALVDAVERYWVREQANPDEPLETKLLRVALIQCCDFAL